MDLMTIVLFRVIQGMGAGMLMAMSLAMVNTYLPNYRGIAIGVVTLAASLGTAFGPALGGVLCHFHWSYIFFINVPIGIICIIFSMKYMSKIVENKPEKQKLDIVGAFLILIMMFSFIYYMNEGGDMGWTSHEAVFWIFTMLVSAGILVWWEQRYANPLVSLRLFKIKDVIGGNMVSLLLYGGMAGSYLLMPYFLLYGQGYETIEMGLILIANSIGIMVVGPVVGKISDKTGTNTKMISLGCLVAALGFFMMMLLHTDTSLLFILLSLFVMGAGVGTALVASTNLCFRYSKSDEAGEMSGIVNTFRQAGSTTGVATMQAVFAATIVVPSVYIIGDFEWMMTGFKPAFLIAVIFALVAFVISMFIRDNTTETK